jgi:hypothetical protein
LYAAAWNTTSGLYSLNTLLNASWYPRLRCIF